MTTAEPAPADSAIPLVDALTAAGWKVVGGRANVYTRLAVVDGDKERLALLVPMDPSMADYDDLMGAALQTLEMLFFDGRSAQQALNRIRPGVYL